jgi:hypothetical protein
VYVGREEGGLTRMLTRMDEDAPTMESDGFDFSLVRLLGMASVYIS